jgi:hypothetical protein
MLLLLGVYRFVECDILLEYLYFLGCTHLSSAIYCLNTSTFGECTNLSSGIYCLNTSILGGCTNLSRGIYRLNTSILGSVQICRVGYIA